MSLALLVGRATCCRERVGHGPGPAHRRAGKVLLEELRDTVKEATGAEKYELAELQRISLGRLISLVGGVLLVSVLVSFAANWSAIADALGEAELAPFSPWPPSPTSPGRCRCRVRSTCSLPLVQTPEVMLGQSFLNRFTPASGEDLSAAATSIGLTSAASGVMQTLFIVVFLAWSGRGQGRGTGFELPDVNVLALVWFTPLGRMLDNRLAVSARRVLGEVRALAADPAKMALLLGGAGLGKLLTIMPSPSLPSRPGRSASASASPRSAPSTSPRTRSPRPRPPPAPASAPPCRPCWCSGSSGSGSRCRPCGLCSATV